jgi:glycosyltransferase involved in cell wall biosynthesis
LILTMMSTLGQEPSGGISTIWSFAEAMAARGHEVHIVHQPIFGPTISSLDEVDWYDFGPEVIHHFPKDGDAPNIDGSEFVFSGVRPPPELGHPLVWVQGWEVFPPSMEAATFGAPFPKVCISTYMRSVALSVGVRPSQAVYVPLAIHHDKYRLTRPMAGRAPRVAVQYNPAPWKGPEAGLEALRLAKARVPELEAVLFGLGDRGPADLGWVTYVARPSQDELVDEIYNGSRAYLSSSRREGFGLPSLEAMACGCAAVTTDSGGPRDYAVDGQTARVVAVDDAVGLADALVGLLTDEPARLALAERGRRRALEFNWEHSAAELEAFLDRYRSDPDAYQQAESEITLPERV